MFLGTYAPKLDEKGRVILPAKFWDELSAGLVVTRGLEHCVFVYAPREFEDTYAKMRQAPVTSKQGRDFVRAFLSGASQETPDKQRRVTIPPMLREWAGLDRDLTIIGAGNRAEIWDTEAWTTYYESIADDFSNMSEEVIPGLF